LNGSVISVLGNPGYAAYAASKAGVRVMARVMASELSPRGIRVNVVAPGAIRTPIWGAASATAARRVRRRVRRSIAREWNLLAPMSGTRKGIRSARLDV
jgi:NAD(P)-dependent dehydrogenase (short-subunit alcohol dehydrogenase family)